VVAIVMVPLGFWLGRSAVEQALLIASILLILLTELLNSALEAVVDRIGPQRHELSKRAKDMGSAAAFVSMVTAALVWIIIALDRFGN
jgi:diacylglycerol kinase (ATP)